MRLITRYKKIPCTSQGNIKRRAIDGTRTRDLHLGKVAYYQLYYYRTESENHLASRAITWQAGQSPGKQGNHLTSR